MAQDSQKNLKNLPEGFGIEWLTRLSFRLDGYEFNIPRSLEDFLIQGKQKNPDVFYLSKTSEFISRYLQLFKGRLPSHILELGLFRGGSAAFMQLLAKPQRMLAVELTQDPLPLLDQFIVDRELTKRMHVKYGVDQADAPRLRELVHEYLGEDRSVDLVVDDASHLLGPTRTSFDTVFPYLRPGGSYVIEDWAAQQILCNQWLDKARNGHSSSAKIMSAGLSGGMQSDLRPLHLMAVEATLATIAAPGIITRVIVDKHWLRIVRGGKVIEDPKNFSLRAITNDQFGLLESTPSDILRPFLDT